MNVTLGSAARYLGAALAGALGWMIGFFAAFVPAQSILASPAHQSPKMLAVFSTLEPLPRTVSPPILLAIVLVVSLGLVAGYRLSRPDPTAGWLARGLRFGTLAWLLMVPWFELYLPWNVLHEPLPLVVLEAACWWIVLVCSGLGIAIAHGRGKALQHS